METRPGADKETRPPVSPFVASASSLRPDDYIVLEYSIEASIDPWEAAIHLATECSTAMWERPGGGEDLRIRHGAKVIGLDDVRTIEHPSWHSPFHPSHSLEHARVKIAYPILNFGPRLPNLLTVALGEGAFYAPGITSIKLTDLLLPDSFLAHFQGPRFGIEGLRDAMRLTDRPFFCGVVKPNVGLDPETFSEIAYQALVGGLDIAKDDELLADTDYSPLPERARQVARRVKQAVAETGEAKLALMNITDEVDRLLALHDAVFEAGGNSMAIMLNAMPVGLSAARMVAKHTRLPMFSHFDFIAPYTRVPGYGVASTVITRLLRLAGFDGIIMPGLGSRMLTTTEEVQANMRACLEPLGSIRPSLPLAGGSDWAGSLENMLRTFDTLDFSFIAGRGVFGHPMGPAAGARSVRQAWDAWQAGSKLESWAVDRLELSAAIAAFGPKVAPHPALGATGGG